jgi:hypothetical protein
MNQLYISYINYILIIYYKVSPCISTMGENKPTQFHDFFGGPPEIWDFGLPTGEVGEKPPTMEDKLIQRLRRYLVSCCVLLMTCSKCLRFMKVMKVVLQRTMIYNLRLWLGSPWPPWGPAMCGDIGKGTWWMGELFGDPGSSKYPRTQCQYQTPQDLSEMV